MPASAALDDAAGVARRCGGELAGLPAAGYFDLRHHEPDFDGWSWQQELQSGLGASASLAGRIGREMGGMEGVLLAFVVVFAVYP